MNSFNHYSLGAIGAWMYSRILGIRPGESGGYETFIYEPQVSTLQWAQGWYETPYGKIESSWRIERESKIINLVVPKGTQAQVRLPHRAVILVMAGTYEFIV